MTPHGGPRLTWFDFAVADGAVNMALDEAMMEGARAGRAALRLYAWRPWCLSIGRNQAVPPLLLGRPRAELEIGRDVVRRPTGGRSVFHGPEVTYAFACPDRAWGGPRSVYARLHRALRAGLETLGVELDRPASDPGAAGNGVPDLAPGPAECFRDPAPGEIIARGRKLVGSAQWRHRGALLQHGSILLSNRQSFGALGPEDRVRQTIEAPPTGGAAIGMDELLERMPSMDKVVATLGRAVVEELGCCGAEHVELRPVPPPDIEAVDKYRGSTWQWRRDAPDAALLATAMGPDGP